MKAILLNLGIVISLLAMALLSFIACMVIIGLWLKDKNSDKIIIIDSNNRWRLYSTKLFGKNKFMLKEKAYFLSEDSSLLSEKGKALFIFSENKPHPLKLTYNKSSWLDSESLKNLINNNLLQMLLKANKRESFIVIIGAIGGIIAGLASVITLIIVSGAFKV